MIYNCHIHTFREVDIARRYLPLGLVRILASTPGFKTVGFLLNLLNPITTNAQFKRYLKMVEIGKYKSQRKIFEKCAEFYPVNSRFLVVSMDMAYMKAGKVPRPYMDQLQELNELRVIFPDTVLPFVHLDPRRPGMMDMLKKCVEEWNFKGIKIYPNIGYFPYDARLLPMWEYAEKNNIPVIAHCSPYNPTYNKGWPWEIKEMLKDSKIPVDIHTCNRKRLCSNFSNPLNYEYILSDYKNIRLCLAHFGSEYFWNKFLDEPGDKNNWFLIIKQMLETHKNLYSDISFTLNNREFFPLLKVLLNDENIKKQILFGSDFYMVESVATERRFGLDLRGYLGEKKFKLIAHDNPEQFLK